MALDPLELIHQREAVLKDLAGGIGCLHPLAEGKFRLRTKQAQVDTAAIDAKTMAVPGVITTQDEDNSKDIVVTAGMDLTIHSSNPVVLYEHGFSRLGTCVIAKACDPAGNYQVKLEEGRARSVSYFSPKIQESEQIFELYAEGLLRGLSVGIIPVATEYRRDSNPSQYSGWPGMLIASCKLFEYSFCSVPDNPHALADKVLGKGLVCGRPLAEGIFKSIQPHLPERREIVTSGYEGQTMTTAATPPQTPPVKTATQTPPGKNGKVTKDGMNETTGADGAFVDLESDDSTTTTADNADEEAMGQLPDRPVSAIAAEGVYDRLMDMAQFLEMAADRQENERLAVILDALAMDIESHAGALTEFYSSEHPELPPLDKSDTDTAGEELGVDKSDDEPPGNAEEDDDVSKSGRQLPAALRKRLKLLQAARKRRPQHKRLSKSAAKVCTKAAGYLSEIGDYDGELKESHKSAAMHHSRCLKELAQSDDGEMGDDEETKRIKAENGALRKKLGDLVGQHQELLKQFRRARRGT